MSLEHKDSGITQNLVEDMIKGNYFLADEYRNQISPYQQRFLRLMHSPLEYDLRQSFNYHSVGAEFFLYARDRLLSEGKVPNIVDCLLESSKLIQDPENISFADPRREIRAPSVEEQYRGDVLRYLDTMNYMLNKHTEYYTESLLKKEWTDDDLKSLEL